MNQKISEIKTYKALFEYIGADFIKEEKYKDKNDLELIIDSYQMALDKKYINPKPQGMRPLSQPFFQNNYINNNIDNNLFNSNLIPLIPIPYIQPNNVIPLNMDNNINNNINNNNNQIRPNLFNSGNSFRNSNRDRNRNNRDNNRERRNRDRRDRDRRRRRGSRSRSRSRSYSSYSRSNSYDSY